MRKCVWLKEHGMSLVMQHEWLKHISLVMKRVITHTDVHIVAHFKARRRMSLCFLPSDTLAHTLSVTDKQSFRKGQTQQTFCFAPARGHDPRHLRLMPAWVQRLRRDTDLVPQVHHSHCRASPTRLSSNWWKLSGLWLIRSLEQMYFTSTLGPYILFILFYLFI